MISIVQLGAVDYATGLKLQQQLVGLRKEGKIGDVLLLLEHKPVITLGRNAKAKNVVASTQVLDQRGVDLFECDRGGDVTFHGPGQIVGYPIFDLRGFARGAADVSSASNIARKTLGVIEFVRRLEEVLIRTCADFAIPTERVPGLTGVWTNPEPTTNDAGTAEAESNPRVQSQQRREGPDSGRAEKPWDKIEVSEGQHTGAKIAAIGVHISRSVTSHGFALNVNTDLSYFKLIIPCGITSKPVTSMQKELRRDLDLNAVAESISRNVGVVFQSQILWVETLDALLGGTVGVPMKPPAEFRQLHQEDDTTWA